MRVLNSGQNPIPPASPVRSLRRPAQPHRFAGDLIDTLVRNQGRIHVEQSQFYAGFGAGLTKAKNLIRLDLGILLNPGRLVIQGRIGWEAMKIQRGIRRNDRIKFRSTISFMLVPQYCRLVADHGATDRHGGPGYRYRLPNRSVSTSSIACRR